MDRIEMLILFTKPLLFYVEAVVGSDVGPIELSTTVPGPTMEDRSLRLAESYLAESRNVHLESNIRTVG
ncbi:hypothetical protein Ddye_009939 [Dipteronia dyeriana]|uniref:Uncharacterized protein n=1 Tax=Dipteronia dyeriana TaxID=168575 RepID=A0AAD9XCP7_9ROSI|nr:hypothetical protein Ddye_009939 [Dipteronia dyeriana]